MYSIIFVIILSLLSKKSIIHSFRVSHIPTKNIHQLLVIKHLELFKTLELYYYVCCLCLFHKEILQVYFL